MGHQENFEDVLDTDEGLKVGGTDIYQSWEHEVVSVDEELHEEVNFLSLNVEVVRVYILDYVSKV